MKLLYYLTNLFVDTFGITRPTKQGRKQAAFFILGLMLLLIAGVTLIGVVLHLAMR